MLIKIYDQDGDYEVDMINLDNYDLEGEGGEELLSLLQDIIESYTDDITD
jgi:hypothetical protein